MHIFFIHEMSSQLKHKCLHRGALLFPLNLGRVKRIGSNISSQPGSPLPRVPRTRGAPSPPLDQGSGARLQGNAATNQFLCLRD